MRDARHRAARDEWRARIADNDTQSVIRFGLAIFARKSVLDNLPQVEIPTLVIVGEEDTATPPSKARNMAEAIPGARLEVISKAGHISTLAEPARVSALLEEFLGSEGSR